MTIGIYTLAQNSTAALIQAAEDAASAIGGGVVLFPTGTYLIDTTLTKRAGTIWQGAGVGATTLKLANSTNADLIKTVGFDSLTGGGTTGGASEFVIQGMTLDGNKANNSSGRCLAIYGFKFTLRDLDVMNTKGDGLYSEWGTGGTDMEATFDNVRVHDGDAHGWNILGPHDSYFSNCLAFKNATDGFRLTAGGGYQMSNCHAWGTEQNHAYYIATQTFCTNCQAEGASVANVAYAGGNGSSWYGGHIFGTGAVNEIGVILSGSIQGLVVDTLWSGFGGAGSYLIDNTGAASSGSHQFRGLYSGTIGGGVLNGNKVSGDTYAIRVTDAAQDVTEYFRAAMRFEAKTGGGGDEAFRFDRSDGTDDFVYDGNTHEWEARAGASFVTYSDNGSTKTGGFTGGVLSIADGIAAPSATVGLAKIYVDTADGDLKVIFGDGFIKTIVVDS